MKKVIPFLLFFYGTFVCALNTFIVNKTPYEAILVFTTGASVKLPVDQNSYGHGFFIPGYEKIPLYQVVINKDNDGYYGHHERLVFEINKTLLPFSSYNKKDDVVINLEWITLPNEYRLYLEEPPLSRDKDNSADKYKHSAPMIFSYQHNHYGNQYPNHYGNIYNDIYSPNEYGLSYEKLVETYGRVPDNNAALQQIALQYAENTRYSDQFQQIVNQYGRDYGKMMQALANNYQHGWPQQYY